MGRIGLLIFSVLVLFISSSSSSSFLSFSFGNENLNFSYVFCFLSHSLSQLSTKINFGFFRIFPRSTDWLLGLISIVIIFVLTQFVASHYFTTFSFNLSKLEMWCDSVWFRLCLCSFYRWCLFFFFCIQFSICLYFRSHRFTFTESLNFYMFRFLASLFFLSFLLRCLLDYMHIFISQLFLTGLHNQWLILELQWCMRPSTIELKQ